MPWVPSTSLLGTHAELATFSHQVQYYEPGTAADPLAVPPVEATADVYYNVRITPQESNPNTITFTEGLAATISGYFKQAFNDTLTVKSSDGVITTVSTLDEPVGGVFDKINRETLQEVISFKADTTRSRVFTYDTKAYKIVNGAEVTMATNQYTILLQDKNWDPGRINLKELVSYASSK